MKLRVPLTLGDLVDRLTILRVKLYRLPAEADRARVRVKSHDFLVALGVDVPEVDTKQLLPLEKELDGVHRRLWDAEDQLRLAAAELSDVDEVDVDKWLELASPRTPDNPAYCQLKSYLIASQEIRRLNKRRHELVGQIDQLAGDETEPKHYQGASHVEPHPPADGSPGPPGTPAAGV